MKTTRLLTIPGLILLIMACTLGQTPPGQSDLGPDSPPQTATGPVGMTQLVWFKNSIRTIIRLIS